MPCPYPASGALTQSISSLFDSPADGLIALGIGGFPPAAKGDDADAGTPVFDRVAALRAKLEGWVRLYAAEAEEFDSPGDLIRLRSEARAVLMVLRELWRAFPEAHPPG